MNGITRRRFLQGGLALGGAALIGCAPGAGPPPPADAGADGGDPDRCPDPFAGGILLGTVPFLREGAGPFEVPFGAGLDGRLYTNLSTLDPGSLVLPVERFYIRTRYPDLLDPNAPFPIAVRGLVRQPLTLTLGDLAPLVEPMGVHLMECSGNGPNASFGLMSACAWSGVPMRKILDKVELLPGATRVLVSGYDMHSQPSQRSRPGASWIFSLAELEAAGAFLATAMNGAPLPPDHGAPARLYVPGWYGCTCVKWVDEIVLVGEDEPSTDHMREFASRTHQSGVPPLARDFRPASMDQAAMPVRVEKWRVGGRIAYRVVGILWGGSQPTDALAIRIGASAAFEPVAVCPRPTTHATWTLWSHPFRPPSPGEYEIDLRITDARIPTRRLDTGYYRRTIAVDEV